MLYLEIINTFLKHDIRIFNCKLSKELKNSISLGHTVLELLIKTVFWLIYDIKNSWPTKNSMPLLSSLDSLLSDAYIIFHKSVDNFEIAHKTY